MSIGEITLQRVSEINFNGNSNIDQLDFVKNGVRTTVWKKSHCSGAIETIQLGDTIYGGEADPFGYSVSMNADGNRIIVGEPWSGEWGELDGVQYDGSGRARIYEYDDSGKSWNQLGETLAGRNGDNLGIDVSMNAAGDRIAVGAEADGPNYVRIYKYSAGKWNQLGSDIVEGQLQESFGGSICLNEEGNRIVIAARNNDDGGSSSGCVRIYEYFRGSWNQLGSDIQNSGVREYFGSDVSMNAAGDRVIIKASRWVSHYYYDKVRETRKSFCSIYEYSSGSWNQLGSNIYSEHPADAGGGVSINAVGDRVVIGTYGNDDGGESAGSARIYEYSSGSWNQLGSDIDGENAHDALGLEVSMNAAGDRIAISSPHHKGIVGSDEDSRWTASPDFKDTWARFGGKVQIYEYCNNAWTPIGDALLGEVRDLFGKDVNMNAAGDRVVIGASGLRAGTFRPGAGYVKIYQLK